MVGRPDTLTNVEEIQGRIDPTLPTWNDTEPYRLVLRLKQTGSVMEYRDQFELVTSGTMRNVDPEIVKGIFLNGLKEERQAELQLYEHETLAQLMKRAQVLEARNWAWKEGGVGGPVRKEWKGYV